MKTIDRKELRTNELSQQLDQITVYAKSNAKRIAIWAGGAVVLAVLVFGLLNHRSSQVTDGWAKLGASQATDPGDQIREAREVAEADLTPSLTIQAWLRVGVIAMLQTTPSAPVTATKMDWQKTAEEAFAKVVTLASKDTTARGQALMSLGVLAENAGKSDAAGYYKKIIDDRQFDGTPFKAQAEFRLKGFEAWLKPVVIAPAPPPPPPPAPVATDPNLPDMIPVDAPPPTPPASPTGETPASSTPPPAASTPEAPPTTDTPAAPDADQPASEPPPAASTPPEATPPAAAP